MSWLDTHQSNYLAWAWLVTPCGLSLISDYNGTPTQTYGQGFHDHLASLAASSPLATSLNLVASANPATVGQNVVFTATVTPTASGGSNIPSGDVVFSNQTTGQTLGTITLANGTASITTSFSVAGTYNIVATYNGDSNFNGSNKSLTEQISPATSNTPASITPLSGNNQTSPVLGAFPINLSALVQDSANNPVAGASVTFVAPVAGPSGTFSGTSANSVTVTTDSAGKATAPSLFANSISGSFIVTATVTGVANTAAFNLTTTAPGSGGTNYTYYLPFLANQTSSGYTTYLVFQNRAATKADFIIKYYDINGNALTTPALSGSCANLVAHAECLAANPLAVGQTGAGIIVSSQPLAVIVAESTPYGGSAYAVSAGASNNLIAPLSLKNAYGDFNTTLYIFNAGVVTNTVNLTQYAQDGTATLKTLVAVGPETSVSVDNQTSTLGTGFNGWTELSSPDGSQLVAQVLEQSQSRKFVAIANAQPLANTATILYAPAIFKGAFAFNTGANIINPNSNSVTVNITYYDDNGTSYPAPAFQLAPNALISIYQGAANGLGLPSPNGLPAGFSGAAIINSTGGNIAMVVNESAATNPNSPSLSGVYGAATNGGGVIGLPVMANGGFGYTTGTTILNSSSNDVSGSIQYYQVDGSVQGNPQSFTIAAHASKLIYQGDPAQGLPSGANAFYGTAVITQANNGHDLIATTNAEAALFYTYTETGS
jgi:hypothetical protein